MGISPDIPMMMMMIEVDRVGRFQRTVKHGDQQRQGFAGDERHGAQKSKNLFLPL